MRVLTVTIGTALVLLGVAGYVVSGAASVTALIPAFVGVLLLACGALAGTPARRRHAIHVAAAVSLLGFLGALPNAVRIGQVVAGTAARPLAVVSSAVMAVLLLLHLVASVRSFVQARRTRALSRS